MRVHLTDNCTDGQTIFDTDSDGLKHSYCLEWPFYHNMSETRTCVSKKILDLHFQ